jgi:hypothetical protein
MRWLRKERIRGAVSSSRLDDAIAGGIDVLDLNTAAPDSHRWRRRDRPDG